MIRLSDGIGMPLGIGCMYACMHASHGKPIHTQLAKEERMSLSGEVQPDVQTANDKTL